jgi:uncharacterized protein YjeT (DUF2065 family)
MAWTDVLTALCLVLVIEGLLPFLAPARWKEAMRQVAGVPDGSLRAIGLVSMILGVVLLYLVRSTT